MKNNFKIDGRFITTMRETILGNATNRRHRRPVGCLFKGVSITAAAAGTHTASFEYQGGGEKNRVSNLF